MLSGFDEIAHRCAILTECIHRAACRNSIVTSLSH
jgi:hypothetical protein